MSTPYQDRPLGAVITDAATAPYWAAAREGVLKLRRCTACAQVHWYPRPVCPYCYSMNHRWVPASCCGTVHSWTVAHHPFHPGFKPDLPYTLVTVDLEEGVRLNAQARGLDAKDLRIGLPVKIVFELAAKDLTLPVVIKA